MDAPSESEEDKLLQKLLKKDMDPNSDLLIELLQFCIQKNVQACPHARIGGEEGLRMNRTAFAVMIKYSCLTDDIEEVLCEVEH